MRILLVSTLKRKVTVDVTASRSHVVYELGSRLAKRGHHVDLLGTADSVIPGVVTYGVTPKAFVEMYGFENEYYAQTSYLLQLEKRIEKRASEYDIIHNHTFPEFINLYATEHIQTPMLTTLHAQATPEYDSALSLFPKAHLVSISQTHKSHFHKANIEFVVYNGVDTSVFAYQEKKQDYMLWLGRLGKAKNKDGTFADAKGVGWAIKLAKATSQKLIIGGNVEDMAFYEQEVKPHLSDKITWYGTVAKEQSISRSEVVKLMQGAKVFLMTINWEEPFGLVMAEAMSCGTPVIGFNRGAVSELVVDGKTGFVVDSQSGIEGLQQALSKISEVSPQDCRTHIEQNFSIEKMVDNYVKLYEKLASQGTAL